MTFSKHNNTHHNGTKHNDTQHNDTQHYDTQHYDIQHYNIQHNDTQHCNAERQLCGVPFILSVTYKPLMLSVIMLSAQCRGAVMNFH